MMCAGGGQCLAEATLDAHAGAAQSWADVYYFCGSDLQYCTCDFTWNARGWGKALLLWNFVLTAALVRCAPHPSSPHSPCMPLLLHVLL